MTGEPRILVDGLTDAVYVAWGDRGSIYRITPGGELTEQLREPESLALMVHDDEVAERAAERIRDVPMAKRTRAALAEALGLDEL